MEAGMKTNRVIIICIAAGDMGAGFVLRFLDNDDTAIATDMHDGGLLALEDGGSGRLHRITDNIAHASPDSDFVTGQTIVVDGGNTRL
jgi:NAD(P)-dependent dehydrogenase (short-subunit alcohol dehydrogenase family)